MRCEIKYICVQLWVRISGTSTASAADKSNLLSLTYLLKLLAYLLLLLLRMSVNDKKQSVWIKLSYDTVPQNIEIWWFATKVFYHEKDIHWPILTC